VPSFDKPPSSHPNEAEASLAHDPPRQNMMNRSLSRASWRGLQVILATLATASVLVHCSSSSPASMDAGQKVVRQLPEAGPDSEIICGARGQACCGSSQACNSGLVCNPAGTTPLTCVPCGASGEPCCVTVAGSSDDVGCSSPSLVCATLTAGDSGAGATSSCVACGTVGALCCTNALCTSTGSCCDQMAGNCVGADAHCSNGGVCGGGGC
jgi:hypothetical protein